MHADPLSDLLDFLDARCDLSGRLVAGGTWARRFTNLDAIKFSAVTEGTCWYCVDGMPAPAQIHMGDVLITNGTRTLTMASRAELIARAPTLDVARDANDQYRLGDGRDFSMLGGIVRVDADRQALLLSGLPPRIHIKGTSGEAEPLSWLLRQLVIEMQGNGKNSNPGGATVVSGLTQLLFVQSLRAYLAQATQRDEGEGADQGWLKGFGDPKLAVVLGSMHGDPARAWTLDTLAKQAGMSRTSLAIRFRELMGVPPLTYLTRWRMHLARRALRAGASVSEAANAVGYASESAFSGAFQRVMNMAPGAYRRGRSPAHEGSPPHRNPT